ncbi:MAG: hypothetical protein M1819_004220 [Sarea resinae]|nr:MAG: hypothetical protein M1819_004220 [Sarea resinae]
MGRFDLPGFTLPLNWAPHESFKTFEYEYDKNDIIGIIEIDHPAVGGGCNLLPNALHRDDALSLPLTTLRELSMLQLMNSITDKPDWDRKVFDEEITSKWKTEALALEDYDFTQAMVDWVVEELKYKAEIFRATGAVPVYNGDVVKSDSAVSESIKIMLKAAAAKLENIPEPYKDYHPGSDGKVLDLVHPSLCPLVYGRSRILPNSLVDLDNCIELSGTGSIISVPRDEDAEATTKSDLYNTRGSSAAPYSKKFQWLPCDVQIKDGRSDAHMNSTHEASTGPAEMQNFHCRITSYINNLHPEKHKDLYVAIEHLIARAIPLWDMALSPLIDQTYSTRIKYDSCEYDRELEDYPDDQKPQRQPNETEDEYEERLEHWYESVRQVKQPEPEEFTPDGQIEYFHQRYCEIDNYPTDGSDMNLREQYRESGLQVIVKLANIHLTPEKPEYEGGTWHVEGQLNEHICATALYYYDSHNITESRLAFRQMSKESDASGVDYMQEQHDWLDEVFGCSQNEPAVQSVGDVLCREGRLLTFPNILQHRVSPFRLEDATKPGHRKIVALFLVDPNIRVISTANVPPQQREWWSEHIRSTGRFQQLSPELQDEVFKAVEDFPIGMDEAKELRLELMEERKKFVVNQDQNFTSQTFSLCEH